MCYGEPLIRKLLVAVASLGFVVAALVAVAYVTNATPVVPRIGAATVDSARPYVVKLHAQWCPVCRIGKGAWSEIEEAYAGQVNLLVLDFTNEATTAASRVEAQRLGLEAFFEEYAGVTGPVAVLDGRTREVTAMVSGRDFAPYRAAIDETLSKE
jgi:thiol-disulfide isomerase/thioredoxin